MDRKKRLCDPEECTRQYENGKAVVCPGGDLLQLKGSFCALALPTLRSSLLVAFSICGTF